MSLWPGKLRELGMLLLAGGAEEVMAYERVELEGVAASFVVSGLPPQEER
jgi:hypothetical protein